MKELKSENQQLQETSALQASEKAALQQLLADTRARHERRERANLETHEQKLKLESTLAAIKRGDLVEGYSIQSQAGNHQAHEFGSTEVFKEMQEQIRTEQKRAAAFEAEILALKEQLQRSEDERMSSESRYQQTIIEQSNTLAGLLNGQQKVQSPRDESAPARTDKSNEELQKILHKLQTATAERHDQEVEGSKQKVDYSISGLVDQVINSKERLAKRAAVQHDVLSLPTEPQFPGRPSSVFCPKTPCVSEAPRYPPTPPLPQSPCPPQVVRTRTSGWRVLI